MLFINSLGGWNLTLLRPSQKTLRHSHLIFCVLSGAWFISKVSSEFSFGGEKLYIRDGEWVTPCSQFTQEVRPSHVCLFTRQISGVLRIPMMSRINLTLLVILSCVLHFRIFNTQIKSQRIFPDVLKLVSCIFCFVWFNDLFQNESMIVFLQKDLFINIWRYLIIV